MKKILFLLVGAIVAFATHADVTVRFQDTGNWGSVNIWPWTSQYGGGEWLELNGYKNGDSKYSFPGPAMTKNEASGYYEITFPMAPETIIFKGPNNQVQYTFVEGKVFTATGSFDYEESYKKFYLRGNFSSWNVDEAYQFRTEDGVTYTYVTEKELKANGVSGQSEGFKINDGSNLWFGASGTFVIGSPFNLSSDGGAANIVGDIPAGATVTFTYKASGTSTLLIENAIEDVYTFALFNGDNKLGDFTGSNPYEVNYPITTPLAADTPLCVKRIKNGTVDNTYGLANAATYNGTKLDNAALQQDGASLVLAATLEGAVTFTLNVTDNVPTSLTVSGGQLHQTEFKDFWLIGKFNGWSQKDEAYHFETTDGKTYTYTVVNEIKSNPGGDGDAGWKINEGSWDNGYEVFGKVAGTSIEYNTVFDLTTSRDAANLEKDIPAGAKMTLTYNPGATSTLLITTKEEPVDPVEPAPTTLYIQMKYDYATQAADAPKIEDDPIPNPVRCHVYNSVTGKYKHEFGSDEEKMDRESFRYSLWKFELTEEDVEKYDAVDFYIYTTKNKQTGAYENPIEYCSDIAFFTDDKGRHEDKIEWYDKTNWTRFIYATATLSGKSSDPKNPSRYACQSMMSFEDFNALNERDAANGGRSALYLVGWGVTFDAEDAEGNLMEARKSLPGTPAEAYPLPADNGCFYLPVYRPSQEVKFKVSFVNVASASAYMSRFGGNAKTLADKYDAASQGCPRHWATFDLGLVGVDTRFDYTQFPGAWQPTYASGKAGSPGSVNMEVNRSVKYNNVNQGDWIVPKDTAKDKNYFVFDSHSECMSVSLIDFDPHPTIVANSCDVQTAELSQDEAISLHNHGLHLDGAGVNGHVYVQNVNYVHGNVTITAAVGNHLSDEGRYSSSYSLLLDGRELSSSLDNGSGNYDIAFLPVSADCNLQIRGKYTNNFNHLTFHSRTSRAPLTTHIELAAPAPVERDGQYVVNKNIAQDGETSTYGVFVKEGLSFQIEGNTDRYYYADFNLADAEIVDSKHYLAEYDVCEGVAEWVKNLEAEGNDWFENGENNDWSSIMKDGVAMPLYFPAVATAADVEELEAQVIEGEIKAVYPFLIDPEAKLVPVASKAPNRAATSNGGAIITIEGKELSYVPMSADVRINVLTDNVISGVEGVAVDAVAEGDVEYYTISGVRVNGEPAPGIYLRRQGNTVAKVVIR